MPGREEIAAVTAEWVAKAENDLKAAVATLQAGGECPTDTVCFHAQQVVEKYLKALLTHLQRPFPKTHNLKKLVDALLPDHRIEIPENDQHRFADYATVARYPGWGEIPLAEARRAMVLARQVRKQVRSLLPKETLRRRKS